MSDKHVTLSSDEELNDITIEDIKKMHLAYTRTLERKIELVSQSNEFFQGFRQLKNLVAVNLRLLRGMQVDVYTRKDQAKKPPTDIFNKKDVVEEQTGKAEQERPNSFLKAVGAESRAKKAKTKKKKDPRGANLFTPHKTRPVKAAEEELPSIFDKPVENVKTVKQVLASGAAKHGAKDAEVEAHKAAKRKEHQEEEAAKQEALLKDEPKPALEEVAEVPKKVTRTRKTTKKED